MESMKNSDCIDGNIYKLTSINSGWTFLFRKNSSQDYVVYKEEKSIWDLRHGGLFIKNNKNHQIFPATEEDKAWYVDCIQKGYCYRPEHLKSIHFRRKLNKTGLEI